MQTKRALSTVVATVLILTITIVAAAIIFSFLVPFVRESLQSSSECLAFRDSLKFDSLSKYNCHTDTLNSIAVKAVQEKSLSISSFALVFVSPEDSPRVIVKNGTATEKLIMIGGSQTLLVPNPGEIRTYIYNAGKPFVRVKINPITNSGRICEESDSIVLPVCEVSLE